MRPLDVPFFDVATPPDENAPMNEKSSEKVNENQVTALLQVLLTVWEAAVIREETMKLVLQDVVPDWRYRYRDYWNDPGAMEVVMKKTYPMREVVKAALQGTLSDAVLQQAVEEVLPKKPS
jgi:hypothetical protein